jgi:hypothetical protein
MRDISVKVPDRLIALDRIQWSATNAAAQGQG